MNEVNNNRVVFFRKIASFITDKKELLKTVVVGQLIYSIIGWIYDNPLYIAVITLYGPVVGGGLMTLGSLLICFFFLLWYNPCKRDWLGINAIDSIKTLSLRYTEKWVKYQTHSYLGKILFVIFYLPIRILLYVLRFANHRIYGNTIAFILLSIFEDPFITTAYLRHGDHGPMSHRDWLVFFGSVLLSNGYWIFRTTAMIDIIRACLKIV